MLINTNVYFTGYFTVRKNIFILTHLLTLYKNFGKFDYNISGFSAKINY